MANWNERDQDWRGARGWREKSGARGAFGEQRYEGGQDAGYSFGGPAQGYRQTDYGAGYGEDRSWNAGSQYDRDSARRDYGGDQRRYGQGGGDYERGRQGDERYGNQGPSRQSYASQSYSRDDGSQGGYGVEWSDRDSYSSRGQNYDHRTSRYRDDHLGRDRAAYRSDYGQGRGGGFGDPNPYVQAATDGETQGGVHRGRGPKDYKRSDDRIREDVNDRLTDDAHIDASGIQVAVKDGEVTLSGTVENRFAKRHAEDLAERISGARHVQNNLRVQEASSRWDQGQADATTPTTRGSTTLS